MKYLIIALILFWWIFSPSRRRKRQLKREQRAQARAQAHAAAQAKAAQQGTTQTASADVEAMVACAHCGVHLPQGEAVFDKLNRAYCCTTHRDAERSSL